MRRLARPLTPLALLVAFAALLGGCGGSAPTSTAPTATAPAPAAEAPTGGTVIVLSLDGFRHDYPARAETPAFDRLAAEGASAGRLIPPWPSQTFPGHATLATGVVAARHGIVNNAFHDREKGLFRYGNGAAWYDAMPIWIHATREGIRSHVFHWVGSEGAWHGTEPAFWRPFDTETTDETKIETIAGWLKAPRAERPGLVMSYLRGCDKAGHKYGPASAEVTACVVEKDAVIGQLLAAIDGLAAQEPDWAVSLVVVADHGMLPTVGGLNVQPVLKVAGLAARAVESGPVANVYLEGAAVDAVRAALAQVPHSTVYARDELPAGWGYGHAGRVGDLVVVAEPGWRFDDDLPTVEADLSAQGLGHHGHDPQLPAMGAVFRAWGLGIAPGSTVETLRAVDIVPLVCHLLGIAPPPHGDGQALDGRLVGEFFGGR